MTEHERDIRDLKILDEIVKGKTYASIAEKFGVSKGYVSALWRAREAAA